MNIFFLDDNPSVAAAYMCDKHVRSKMIIESAIALQSCFTQEALGSYNCPRTKTGKIRKTRGGYANHPSSIWARTSSSNFEWLLTHTLSLISERKFRWPNSPPHFTESFIEWCYYNKHIIDVPQGDLTPYAIAINKSKNCWKIPNFENFSAIEKYRHYYVLDKPFATWTKRTRPGWFDDILDTHRQILETQNEFHKI